MKRTIYVLTQDVHGAIGSEVYSYEAGEVTPKDAAEQRVLDHLVSAGVAEPKKKG